MTAHLSKNEFKFISITVMVLEVGAFLVFIFGTLGAILGTYSGITTTDFILLGFGGIFIALMLMAVAEILQVVMRIEYNTRKENAISMKQVQAQVAEVKATKSIATALEKSTNEASKRRKANAKVSASHSSPHKAMVKKPRIKKVKPRRKK
ncbi:MAG: hypothetical protein Q8O95_02545 [bacterium]|nr:hypothetical protein [bacterium]